MATAVASGTKRVAAYCRVSTDTEAQQNSQENQVEYFRKAITKAGHELVGIYEDEGISGTSMEKRKGFILMLEDAGIDYVYMNPWEKEKRKRQRGLLVTDRKSKFDSIWVKNTSRFARNILAVEALDKLKAKGVYVYFEEKRLSTENDNDMWFITQLLGFDQQESRDKGRSVHWGHKRGAEMGKMHTNGKIYGYSYDKLDTKLNKKEDEAEVIRLMFQLYSEGKGIRVILHHLTEKGYRTRNGKDFTKSSVGRILENPTYCGTLARQRWDTGKVFVDKHSPRKRPEDKWETHPDHKKIDPIISKELFQACQEIRKSKVNTKNQTGIYKGQSEYAGMIFCGTCGSSYTRNQDRGRIFYNCSKKKREGVSACNNPNVSLDSIDKSIQSDWYWNVGDLILNQRNQRIKELGQAKEKLLSRKDMDKEQAVRGFDAEVEALDIGHKRLLNQLGKGNMSEADFEEANAELAQQRRALIAQRDELRKDNEEIDADIRAIEAQVERLQAIDPDDWHTENEIRDEVKRIVVVENEFDPGKPSVNLEYKILDLIKRAGKDVEKAL